MHSLNTTSEIHVKPHAQSILRTIGSTRTHFLAHQTINFQVFPVQIHGLDNDMHIYADIAPGEVMGL